MNALGKIKPSLVDPHLLKELKQIKELEVVAKQASIDDFKKQYLGKVMVFMYKYGFAILAFLVIFYFIYQRYTWYQKQKAPSQEKFINPGKYVCTPDNNVQILQRPIPPRVNDDMNKQIRDLYLDNPTEKTIRCSQQLPTVVNCKNTGYVSDGRLDNIYNQPVYAYNKTHDHYYDENYEDVVDRGCPGPVGRNAPLRAEQNDQQNYYEYVDYDDALYG